MGDTSTNKIHDFFLYYHDSDWKKAEKILEYLENPSNGGFKGFILDRDTETGTKSHNLDIALRTSRLMLILLSKEALQNKRFVCVLETCFAFHLRKNNDIVPIYLEKIEKPPILRTIYGIDYSCSYFWNQLKCLVSI